MQISDKLRTDLIKFQKNELTEAAIYRKLAKSIRSDKNRKVLMSIADDEERHNTIWEKYTGVTPKINRWKLNYYYFISKLLGLTFGLKLMERGEEGAQEVYSQIKVIPEAAQIMKEEDDHEHALLEMIDEEHLDYMGSVVLGLNDALVELTGVLAGLTLALQNPKLIALTGSITGIAAAFSMAASEYLSTKSEESEKNAGKASFYTGLAYIITVIILILPYLFISNIYLSLSLTISGAIGIIAAFNYYISVVRDLKFKRRFLEMAGISFGVALLSFGIGYVLRHFFGVDI